MNFKVIAALFVDPRGCYSKIPFADLWDEKRDARGYEGPMPVVAHPPCTRWCLLAGFVQARYGYKIGDDGGTFESALMSVRKWGGVLEHPAYTKAWAAYGLPKPNRKGGWLPDGQGGFVAHVEQGRYGHPAKKATWLYAFGTELPSLKWGSTPDNCVTAQVSRMRVTESVSWCGNKTKTFTKRKRIDRKEASATPIEFRDVLINMALSVYNR